MSKSSRPRAPTRRRPNATKGPNPWDVYAPFYDWENAQTMGRRDVRFWKHFVSGERGRVLELGCGTGRILIPIARAGARATGVDFSREMVARAIVRARRLPKRKKPELVRGDLRQLPFASQSFARVIAPYGVLQSLTSEADLEAAIGEVRRILRPGGLFGIDLVPDLTDWRVYRNQVRFQGKLRGQPVTLVESVRQRPKLGVTVFEEDFRVGSGRGMIRRRFSLTFRTVPMDTMLSKLTSAGFDIEQVTGTYAGGVWTTKASVWLVVGRRTGRRPRR